MVELVDNHSKETAKFDEFTYLVGSDQFITFSCITCSDISGTQVSFDFGRVDFVNGNQFLIDFDTIVIVFKTVVLSYQKM